MINVYRGFKRFDVCKVPMQKMYLRYINSVQKFSKCKKKKTPLDYIIIRK